MNKIKILVISGLMFFSGTYLASAQEAKALTGQTASARIVAPLILSLTPASKLDFGTLVKTSTTINGTAILSPISTATAANLRSLTNLGSLGTSGLKKGSVPQFNLTGEVGLTYKITLPATVVVTNDAVTSGTPATADETMNVTDFTYAFSDGGAAVISLAVIQASTSPQLTIAATNIFKVGATLTVDKAQSTGTYAGSYTISVEYD